MKPNDEQLQMLKQLCSTCRRESKCKDHNKYCFAKSRTFLIARMVYKKRVKKGLIVEDNASS